MKISKIAERKLAAINETENGEIENENEIS
jgi:hypothetical protein